ncbi:MAG: carbohydrate ABC transporter permease [Acidothermaceae bacterium]
MDSRPGGSKLRRTVFYVLLSLFALVYLGPFAIQIATSFKTGPDATAHSLSLIPNPFSVAAWKRIFGFSNDTSVDFPLWLLNSAIVSTCVTLARVFLDSLAGYALARLSFPGRRAVFALVLATMSVPGVVLLIPRFLVIKELGIYNTYAAMIFPIAMDAMGIFLMRQFFLQIPLTIEEAARIDGAGIWRTYWYVALPMAKAGLLTLTILSFQGSWNEFAAFLVAGDSPRLYTLTKGLALFQGGLGTGNQYPLTLGAALLTTIPVAIVFFVFQRRFVGAQLSAGVKG